MAELNLEQQVDKAISAIQEYERKSFRSCRAKEAKILERSLPEGLIKELGIRMTEDGTFFFEFRDNRYVFQAFTNQPREAFQIGYRWMKTEEEFYKYLAERELGRNESKEFYSVGDDCVFADCGITYRQYLIALFSQNGNFDSISFADYLIERLDEERKTAQEKKESQKFESDTYSFEKVLSWYSDAPVMLEF